MTDLKKQADSYINLVTGLGTSYDKSKASGFVASRILGQVELAQQYEQDALTARVVDRLVDDAVNCTWNLTGTDEAYDWESVESRLDDLGAKQHIGDAWRWSRLYGGAICIMAINDGQTYDKPLDLSQARDFTGLSVVDSTICIPQGYVAGLGSQAYAKPTAYQVVVPFGKSTARVVHPSRVIRFDGLRVPASRMINNGGWAPSLIQRCHRSLRALTTALQYAEALLQEISVMVLSIPGLTDQLCGGPENVSNVKSMLEQLRWSVDTLHLLAIDKEMSFTEIKRSVDGVAMLIDKFESAAVRDTGYPRLILTGEQPGGLNADSKGEVRAYYDSVEAAQGLTLTPALNRLLEVEFAVRRNRGESVPDEWTITYDSLVSMAPDQKATIGSQWATTVSGLIMAGVISPDEAREILITNKVIEMPSNSNQLGVEPEPDDVEEEGIGEFEPEVTIPEDAADARTLARELGIPTVRITRAFKNGLIRGWRLLGGSPRFSRAELRELIIADNPET